jgi:F-type H+-transporting ATPase subunit delta
MKIPACFWRVFSVLAPLACDNAVYTPQALLYRKRNKKNTGLCQYPRRWTGNTQLRRNREDDEAMEPKPNKRTAAEEALPYAQSAFDIARGLRAVDDWEDKLGQLAQIFRDPEIRNMPHDPRLDADTVREIVDIMLDDIGVTGEQRGFVGFLIEEGKLSLLPWIYDGFIDERRKAEAGPEVTVIAAKKLDAVQEQNLGTMLRKHFKTNAEPEVKVDAKLIGGFKIIIGERIYDQSVKGLNKKGLNNARKPKNTAQDAAQPGVQSAFPQAAKPRNAKPPQPKMRNNKKRPPRPGQP